jgi:hypothetical protein
MVMGPGVIEFDPIDHRAGRWAVRRTSWRFAGRSGTLWAVAGRDSHGRPYTALFGPGVDEARSARRFAHLAATDGFVVAAHAAGLSVEW